MRSCSISTSSFHTTSGSILIDWICLAPLTTTVTMPPPALASTRSSAICFCRRSCICCACFIICWMFIRGLHLLHVTDVGTGEHVEQRLHARIGQRLRFQLALFLVARALRTPGRCFDEREGDLLPRQPAGGFLEPRLIRVEYGPEPGVQRQRQPGRRRFNPVGVRDQGF